MEALDRPDYRYSFPFDFLVNERDAGQGTGDPKKFSSGEFTPDDVMISSLISLQMQLYSESLVINSCVPITTRSWQLSFEMVVDSPGTFTLKA